VADVDEVPDGLSERGLSLWVQLTVGRDLPPAAMALAAEAARITDRLERLDRLLRGEDSEWFRVANLADDTCVLVVNSALGEARQQAGMLRQVLATLEDLTPKESDEPGDALAGLMAGLSAPLRDAP
jgi:hypothetical protein